MLQKSGSFPFQITIWAQAMLDACLQQGSFVETNAVKWIQWRAHHTPTVAFMSFHWKGVEREEKYPAFFVNEANNNNNGTHEKMACSISLREGLVHCIAQSLKSSLSNVCWISLNGEKSKLIPKILLQDSTSIHQWKWCNFCCSSVRFRY